MTDEPGVICYCYALYDYLALEPNQLSLRRGDRVAVVSKAGASRGWWKGRLRGKVNPFQCSSNSDQNYGRFTSAYDSRVHCTIMWTHFFVNINRFHCETTKQ